MTTRFDHPITRAAAVVGSRVALARAIGVSKGSIWQWEHVNAVPIKHCLPIEKATGGAVRCEDLRPDVDWGYLRGTAPRPAAPAPEEAT